MLCSNTIKLYRYNNFQYHMDFQIILYCTLIANNSIDISLISMPIIFPSQRSQLLCWLFSVQETMPPEPHVVRSNLGGATWDGGTNGWHPGNFCFHVNRTWLHQSCWQVSIQKWSQLPSPPPRQTIIALTEALLSPLAHT